jgi:hypothetical protein
MEIEFMDQELVEGVTVVVHHDTNMPHHSSFRPTGNMSVTSKKALFHVAYKGSLGNNIQSQLSQEGSAP